MVSTAAFPIFNFIDVSTVVQGGISPKWDNKNVCFIWKGAKKGSDRINYVGTDTKYLADTYGSNSEAVKAGLKFLGGQSSKTAKPKQFWVANVDDTTSNITAGEAVYVLADNAFTITGGTVNMFSDVNPIFADFTINGQSVSAYGVYTNSVDNKLQLFETKADVVEKNPIDLSAAPYSLADSDATTTALVYVDYFLDAISEIMSDSRVYLIGADNTFTDLQKKQIASAIQAATDPAHAGILQSEDENIYKLKATDDTTSLAAFIKNTPKVMCVYDDLSQQNEYKSMALLAIYGTQNFTAASPMVAAMWANSAGITATVFENRGAMSSGQILMNLQGKSCNSYALLTSVLEPMWIDSRVGDRSDFVQVIAADFINYLIAFELFALLRSNPNVNTSVGGATQIENKMSVAYMRLNESGVITGGISVDGETFPNTGYKVFAQPPTGTDKINGIWNTVIGKGLLTGITRKVVESNFLLQ